MRDTIKDGGPAFPRAGFETTYPTDKGNPVEGMSLRDWFAGMALQGICDSLPIRQDLKASNTECRARFCYAQADAMLVQREKATPTP